MSADTTRAATPWPNYALPHGTTVNGYRIERVLGSGGFGVTYLARDLLQQPFAIKEYYPRQFAIRRELNVLAASADDEPLFEECRDRFLREAQALVLLSRVAGAGDGIVRVQTYFEAHGTCFLVMDYVEGASLASVLQREPRGLAALRVCSLLTQLLSAIGVVHRAGLMHRDIKPANIILRDDDRVVLIDFGSSRDATSSQTIAYTQIYSGGYAPPEQMLGMRQGAFSDIYAIGAVCYRAIGGTVVDAIARQAALAAGRPDPQPSAAQIGERRYPTSLLATIDAALKIDATQRPQSVDAMLASLAWDEPAADATVVAASRPVPTAMPPEPRPAIRRRRGVWGGAAGAAALVVIGAAYLLLRSPAAPPPIDRQRVVASTPAPVPLRPAAAPARQRPIEQPAAPGGAAHPSTAVSSEADGAPVRPADSMSPAPTPPAPTSPAERPQHVATTMPPPAPTSTPAPVQSKAAPPAAPDPAPLAEPPQHLAVGVPPPAPASTPAPSQPAAARPAARAPAPPAEPPQHVATTMPPPAPTSTPAPSQSEAARPAAPAPASPAEPPQHLATAMPPPASTPTPAPSQSEAEFPAAPAPALLAEPPQNLAAGMPSPAPRSTPAPSQLEAALPAAPAPAPPAEPPQRQAMVVLPPAPQPTPAPSPSAPSPSPLPSPLERVRAAAGSLPCSILHVTSTRDGLRISGLAPNGQDLDRLLAALRDLGRVAEDITRVDRFACGPLTAMDSLVSQTWDATPPTFAIRLDQREVASGTRLKIDVATTLPALYVDLFPSDGSVRHLLRPAKSGKTGKLHVEWIAGSTPGPSLIVAIGSVTPLDLGARPDTERAAAYVAALQAGLQHSAVPTFADVAVVIVHPAEPTVVSTIAKTPQPRPTNLRSDRCTNIVSRAQLGETLTDAERAELRTDCR